MFDCHSDYDPITPATGALLTEIGVDTNAVREALIDDYVRRCPDREAPADGRWREAEEG